MNSVYSRFLILEEENQSTERLQRRHIRAESVNGDKEYYRINKDAFQFLLNVLEENLPPRGKMFAVPTVVKLARTLRFLAEGSYQKGVGRQIDVGLAQFTFSEVLAGVLVTLEKVLCPQRIVWPSLDEKKEISPYFGCVDMASTKQVL